MMHIIVHVCGVVRYMLAIGSYKLSPITTSLYQRMSGAKRTIDEQRAARIAEKAAADANGGTPVQPLSPPTVTTTLSAAALAGQAAGDALMAQINAAAGLSINLTSPNPSTMSGNMFSPGGSMSDSSSPNTPQPGASSTNNGAPRDDHALMGDVCSVQRARQALDAIIVREGDANSMGRALHSYLDISRNNFNQSLGVTTVYTPHIYTLLNNIISMIHWLTR